MSKLVSLAVAPVLVDALVGGTTPALAASATVPASHVEQCADDGLGSAGTMTLVSSPSTSTTTGGRTSRARAWVYAVAGSTERCVVLRIDGAKVRAKRNQRVDHSVGYASTISGQGVVDTGADLPLHASPLGYGGTTERTHLVTTVVDLVVTETLPADIGAVAPSLAPLGGRTITGTMTTLDFEVLASVWTTTELSRPLTKAQRRKKLAAEVEVAQDRYAARVAEARAVRDEQLAEAAATTGITAAWLTYWAEEGFADATSSATATLKAEKALARRHAADAGRGSDARETYAHDLSLEVPLR